MNYSYNYEFDEESSETTQAGGFATGQEQHHPQRLTRAQAAAQQQSQQEQHATNSSPHYNHQYSKPKSQIFVDFENKPLPFYIQDEEPDKIKYQDLILKNGGNLVEGGVENLVYLSSKEHMGGFIRISYIDDCIKAGHLLNTQNYIIPTLSEDAEPMIDVLGLGSNVDNNNQNGLAQYIQDQQQQLQQHQQQHQEQQQQQQQQEQAQTSSSQQQPAATQPSTPSQSQSQPPTQASPTRKKSGNQNRFSTEKDEYILEQVRKNPKLRNSHEFFSKLATTEMLSMHTGPSIRSRYRIYLESNLKYVYKTDDRNRLIKDSNGELIKISTDELPETLRNKFTPEDDLHLCLQAEEWSKEVCKQNNTVYDPYPKKSLPYSFFNQLYKKFPRHTLNSWRDRYRYFITDGTIEQFKKYYNDCITKNQIPKCLKRVPKHLTEFTANVENLRQDIASRELRSAERVENDRSQAAAEVQPDKEVSNEVIDEDILFVQEAEIRARQDIAAQDKADAEKKKKLQQQQQQQQEEESALDEEIGELKSSNIDDALNRNKTEEIEVPKLSAVETFEEEQEQENDIDLGKFDGDSVESSSPAKKKRKLNELAASEPEPIVSDKQEPTQEEEQAVEEDKELSSDSDDENNEFFTAPKAPSQEIVDDITQLEEETQQQDEKVESQTQPQPQPPLQQTSDSTQSSSQSTIILNYLKPNTKLIETINPTEFFPFADLENPKEILNKYLSETDNIITIYQILNNFGLKDNLISHIIYSSSAETSTIINYILNFITLLQDGLLPEIEDNQLDDQEIEVDWENKIIDNYLPKTNIFGLWNLQMDKLLYSKQEKKLKKFKNDEEIENRKTFIKSSLQVDENEA
ncbi:RAP1 [Candida jiufengensis]|uniref:RAP1 n=1 Tax=Candida jiufengensis TaxID=497108 RepID=UPI0022256BF8|nr:RAP1 [Candida jiufengensis]KAI5952238.1 RAP1 [Candida jiufengensis]